MNQPKETNINGIDASYFEDMREPDYRKAFGLSQSELKIFGKSPAHYLASLEEEKEKTDAMKFGTAFHAYSLLNTPENVIAVKKKVDGRSKEGKEYNANFELENAGKTIINEEEYERVQGMRESILAHDYAGQLLNSVLNGKGMREFAMFGTAVLGDCLSQHVRLKGLADGYCKETKTMFDLKSCEDASIWGFRNAINGFGYGLQNAHYAWLAEQNQIEIERFVFVAVEKKKPFAVGTYQIDALDLFQIKLYWNSLIRKFSECKKSGVYPAYSNKLEIISV